MNEVENEVEALYLAGQWSSQRIQLAFVTLLLYDHAINLSDEVEHFWSGPWTFSRGMYLCIRYLGFVEAVILILGNCTDLLSPFLTSFLIYGVQITIMVLCQAAITTRVWFLFSHRPVIRNIVIAAYIASTLASSLLAGFFWSSEQTVIRQAGMDSARTSLIAWLYVPSLFLHGFLFALKVYRFTLGHKQQSNTYLRQFLKEGMGIFACALGSLLFIIIGLHMTETCQIPVYETALSGGVIFVALTVVSVCRAMLSIKSLAAKVRVDPAWLLSHAELSRVDWRPGATEGEIVVEMFTVPYDLPALSGSPDDTNAALLPHTIGAKGYSGITVPPC